MTIKDRIINLIKHYTRNNYLSFSNYVPFVTKNEELAPISVAFVNKEYAIIDTKIGFLFLYLEKISATNLNTLLNHIEQGKFIEIKTGDFVLADYVW